MNKNHKSKIQQLNKVLTDSDTNNKINGNSFLSKTLKIIVEYLNILEQTSNLEFKNGIELNINTDFMKGYILDKQNNEIYIENIIHVDYKKKNIDFNIKIKDKDKISNGDYIVIFLIYREYKISNLSKENIINTELFKYSNFKKKKIFKIPLNEKYNYSHTLHKFKHIIRNNEYLINCIIDLKDNNIEKIINDKNYILNYSLDAELLSEINPNQNISIHLEKNFFIYNEHTPIIRSKNIAFNMENVNIMYINGIPSIKPESIVEFKLVIEDPSLPFFNFRNYYYENELRWGIISENPKININNIQKEIILTYSFRIKETLVKYNYIIYTIIIKNFKGEKTIIKVDPLETNNKCNHYIDNLSQRLLKDNDLFESTSIKFLNQSQHPLLITPIKLDHQKSLFKTSNLMIKNGKFMYPEGEYKNFFSDSGIINLDYRNISDDFRYIYIRLGDNNKPIINNKFNSFKLIINTEGSKTNWERDGLIIKNVSIQLFIIECGKQYDEQSIKFSLDANKIVSKNSIISENNIHDKVDLKTVNLPIGILASEQDNISDDNNFISLNLDIRPKICSPSFFYVRIGLKKSVLQKMEFSNIEISLL